VSLTRARIVGGLFVGGVVRHFFSSVKGGKDNDLGRLGNRVILAFASVAKSR